MAEVLKFLASSCRYLKEQDPSTPMVGVLVSQYHKVRGEGEGLCIMHFQAPSCIRVDRISSSRETRSARSRDLRHSKVHVTGSCGSCGCVESCDWLFTGNGCGSFLLTASEEGEKPHVSKVKGQGSRGRVHGVFLLQSAV